MNQILSLSVVFVFLHCEANEQTPLQMPEVGYLIIEAEELNHSQKWELLCPEQIKFSGEGVLRFVGPDSGVGYEEDHSGGLIGEIEDWLIVPVEIVKPGRYRVDLKNHHLMLDGDNDVWVHVIDYPLPIRRMGDHAVNSLQWLTWGPAYVYFELEEPGVFQFLIAGRSAGFCIDKIAIFNEQAPVYMYWVK